MSRTTRLTLAALAVCLICPSVVSANESITYSYDARGRLVKVFHEASSSVNQNAQSCYKYDKADNRVNVKTTASSPNPPAACPP